MRILYGIAGEGLGHAVRSRVVIEELLAEHDLRLVASAGAFEYLERHFRAGDDVWELTSSVADLEPEDWESAGTGSVSRWPGAVRDLYRMAEAFEPHAVITDCESFAALFALRHSLPLVSIDHVHAIDRCRHDPGLLRGHEGQLWRNRQLIGAKVPNAAHYVITTFYFPLLLEPRTTLVPPILRPGVLAARPEAGEHLLAYLPADGDRPLARVLAESGIPSRIYDRRRSLTADETEGAVTHRPFGEESFVEDLRTARAVVAGGSFTVLAEAIRLGKPVFASPGERHFGHLVNALYVDHLGYGSYAARPTAPALEGFLERLPSYEQRLAGYSQDGNAVAIATIRSVLASVSARERRRARG